MSAAPQVVPAHSADAEIVAAIHAQCFPRPWSAEDFALFLRQPGLFGWLTGADEPAAFLLMRQVADEAEIITLAVVPPARRRGYASLLLKTGLEALCARGVAACFLEVAVDNAGARALYRRLGFKTCARRRGYYEQPGGTPTDAVVMRREL